MLAAIPATPEPCRVFVLDSPSSISGALLERQQLIQSGSLTLNRWDLDQLYPDLMTTPFASPFSFVSEGIRCE